MKKIYLVLFFLLITANNSFAYIELDFPGTASKVVDSITKFAETAQKTIEPPVKDVVTKAHTGVAGKLAKFNDTKNKVTEKANERIEKTQGAIKEKLKEQREKSKVLEKLEKAKSDVDKIKKDKEAQIEKASGSLDKVDDICNAQKSEIDEQIASLDAEISKTEDISTKNDLEAKKAQIFENALHSEEECEKKREDIAKNYEDINKALSENLSKAMEKMNSLKSEFSKFKSSESLADFQDASAQSVVSEEFLPDNANMSLENINILTLSRNAKLKKAAAKAYERGIKLKKYYKDDSDDGAKSRSFAAYEKSQIADSEPDKANMARISGNTEMMVLVAKEMLEYAKVRTANLRFNLTKEMNNMGYKKKDLREIDYTNYNMYDAYYLSEKEISKRIKEIEKASKGK